MWILRSQTHWKYIGYRKKTININTVMDNPNLKARIKVLESKLKENEGSLKIGTGLLINLSIMVNFLKKLYDK